MQEKLYMENHFWKIVDNFSANAKKLKSEFDISFAEPLKTKAERFCWDYWYVKDQYKLIRTPAEHFFSEKTYQDFENELMSWGEQKLGCTSLSPIWLSYYIDGCEQKMHTDSPHGPWAFVFSITDWSNRSFSGGETFLLKPETLCYWDFFDLNKGAEGSQFIQSIEPQFNRLSVFDPRFPHGVEKVQGAHEPSNSRIVLHGWFTEPAPKFNDLDDVDTAWKRLQPALKKLGEELSSFGKFHGLLSLKFNIEASGKVLLKTTLCNTLIEVETNFSDDVLIEKINADISSIDLSLIHI